MSRPHFFYDSGNIGIGAGEYLIYAHWATIAAWLIVITALVAWVRLCPVTLAPKREWFQFSLRELFLLTLIVALVVYSLLEHKRHAQWDQMVDSLLSANLKFQQRIKYLESPHQNKFRELQQLQQVIDSMKAKVRAAEENASPAINGPQGSD
jgi:hypothetical protein